jgi:DNA repair protein RadC
MEADMVGYARTQVRAPKRGTLAPWVRIVRDGEAPAYDPKAAAPGTDGRIRSPADVVRVLEPRVKREDVEVFYVLILNSQSRLLACAEVTRGILNSSLVHPREVFRLAVAYAAAGIIVAHNHPSGDPTPSADDRAVTRQLVESGRVLDIPVYDALVIGGEGRYLSFAEAGLL